AICHKMASDGADEEKLHQLEQMKWQFTSADASEYAMRAWNFPPELVSASTVRRYQIQDPGVLEKEQPLVVPVILAEYIVLLSGYTDSLRLDDKLRNKLMEEFCRYCPVYGIDEKRRKYYLEDLRQVIKQDSFYSFCGELFSN
ncbi:MAG: HDOD domain-containing protein, partial [Turneriella sp.]|nr:HDOD domain-containing protein [Turneriella sp.]